MASHASNTPTKISLSYSEQVHFEAIADRERVADMLVEILVGFVKTDDGALWIVRFVVEIENILHFADERSVFSGFDYPRFGSVRAQSCFLSPVELSRERSTRRFR